MKVLNDGWTAVTRDRSLSAQFEHSVGVTETGVEIFTLSPKGWTSRLISDGVTAWGIRPTTERPATASACATRFLKGGADAMPDYELLELTLFAAMPRRDTKPLAKALLARFGSFAEVIAAPPRAAAGNQGRGRSRGRSNSRSWKPRRTVWPRPK